MVFGALVAGVMLAAGGPAFAERGGTGENPNVIPVQPETTLVPNQAQPAPMRPAAMTPQAAPARRHADRRAEPADVPTLVRQADAALKARRPAEARDLLEQAETMLLNARTDGEQGFHIQVRDVSAARGALASGNAGAAQRGIAQMIQALDSRGN
jgi:hypothetical protein